MKYILKKIIIFSFINITCSLILLNKTEYSNNFFFDKDKAIFDSFIFSHLNNIISANIISETAQDFAEEIIVYIAHFWVKTRPFPSSIFFDANFLNCVQELYKITFPLNFTDDFYTFFEATGKSMNDFGNEHHCIINSNINVNYYLLQAHIKDQKKLTNYEDFYLLKFLNQNYFYIGLCLPDECENITKKMLKNKEFLDFLYDKLSLSNLTLILDKEKRKEYLGKFKHSQFIIFGFLFLLLIKVIVSIIKSIFNKNYNKIIFELSKTNLLTQDYDSKNSEDEKEEKKEEEKKEKEENEEEEKINEKSLLSDKLRINSNNDDDMKNIYFEYIYGVYAKDDINLYNPFHDNQDNYPFCLKLIKLLDIAENIKLLVSLSNKYYNSFVIKKIYLLKIIVMFMSISLKLMISQIEIPSRSFLDYSFYNGAFFILIKVCIFSPVFWIVLDALTAGFKLMSFIKKIIVKSKDNKLSFLSYSKFFLLLIPKIFLFIIYYIFLHILARNVIFTLTDNEHHIGPFTLFDNFNQNSTFSLRNNNNSFEHHLKSMMPIYINYIDYFIEDNPNKNNEIVIKGNGKLNPSNATNYTYYKYENTKYKVPSPFLTNTDLFINIYLNEFVLLIFMMLITFLSYKIKNNLFDYIILLINVLLYLFLPFVNFINYEKTTNCEDYSLLYILGQNFSEKYTHYFFSFYYLGFMIGVFLFYQNEYNYYKMKINIEESITINSSIGSHSSNSNSGVSFSNFETYINFFPFSFYYSFILFLNRLKFGLKRFILILSIIIILIISSSFQLIQRYHGETQYDEEFDENQKEEIKDFQIKIPNVCESIIKLIFIYEKNFCCIFFFIFLIMFISYPSDKYLIKFCNLNCFILFDRISFSTFCTFNFIIYSNFCSFYLDFKIMMTNIFLNSLGIFILLLILNTFFVCIFELPIRIIIKNYMNKDLTNELRMNFNSGGLLSLSARTTLSRITS